MEPQHLQTGQEDWPLKLKRVVLSDVFPAADDCDVNLSRDLVRPKQD